MNHKEMTAHIRKRLKSNGISARCSLYIACGIKYISISMPRKMFEAGEAWPEGHAGKIALICKINGLTNARKSEINIEIQSQLIYSSSFNFEFHE